MSREFRFGSTDKLNERSAQLAEFLEQMFDADDRPFFVSDDACLYDIHAGDDGDFSQRCEQWYGRKLVQSDFQLPLWQLLDLLNCP